MTNKTLKVPIYPKEFCSVTIYITENKRIVAIPIAPLSIQKYKLILLSCKITPPLPFASSSYGLKVTLRTKYNSENQCSNTV